MKFSYTAVTPDGAMTAGTVDAVGKAAAVQRLQRQQLAVVKVEPARAAGWFAPRVPLLERMLIAQHLHTLLGGGVSLLEALRVVGAEAKTRRQRRLIERIAVTVSGGKSLAVSLEAQGAAWDPLTVGLVRVGEASGTLPENLGYLADELDQRLRLQAKVRAALAYPGVVAGVTLALAVVLVYFVLPKIVPLFSAWRVQLPWTTTLLLRVATSVRSSGWWWAAIGGGALAALRLLLGLAAVRSAWHRTALALPLIGRIVRSVCLANLSRTLGTLLRSGVPVLEALQITAQTSRNLAYRSELERIQQAVAAGQSLASAMASSRRRRFFPPLWLSLVRVGESSGKLDESLGYLNRYYDRDVETALKDFGVLLEPILLVFIGLVVALVASAVISPIYQITGSLRVR